MLRPVEESMHGAGGIAHASIRTPNMDRLLENHTIHLAENTWPKALTPCHHAICFKVVHRFLFWRSTFECNRLDHMPDLVDGRGDKRGNGGSWVLDVA